MNPTEKHLNELVAQFVDDRDAMSDGDLQRLASALRDDPDAASALRDQLVTDELLGQRLAIDRQGFAEQVDQRLHDFHAGQQRLDDQAAQLRHLAEGQLVEMGRSQRSRSWRRTSRWAAAALLLLAAVLGARWSVRWWQPVAMIVAVQGDVQRDGESSPEQVASSQPLMHGESFTLGDDGELHVEYPDGTRVVLNGATHARFFATAWTAAKRVELHDGRLSAAVARQGWRGAMEFTTPVATARVLGTELALRADRQATRLDVFEGTVQIVRRADGQSAKVDANSFAVASPDELTVKQSRWPLYRDGLIARIATIDTGAVLSFPIHGDETLAVAPHGLAWVSSDEGLTLIGGGFSAEDRRGLLSTSLARSGAGTIEFILQTKGRGYEPAAPIVRIVGDRSRVRIGVAQHGADLVLLPSDSSSASSSVVDEPLAADRVVGRLTGGGPWHVGIRWEAGRADVLINGAKTAELDSLPLDWVAGEPLRIEWGPDAPTYESAAEEAHVNPGSDSYADPAIDPNGGQSPVAWQGAISHWAIYNQRIGDDDMARQTEAAMRLFRRPSPPRVLLRAQPISPARIVASSGGDFGPSLVARRFRTTEVRFGVAPAGEFVAAYWDVVDSRHAPAGSAAMSERTLVLEPLDRHPLPARQVELDPHSKTDFADVPRFFVADWE